MADGGHGATITFSSGFFAEIVGISISGESRGVTETTHSTSTNGWKTFQPSDLKDAGEMTVRLRFAPNSTPPITGAAETITTTFPVPSGLSTGATRAASGFLTDFSVDIDTVGDDAMEAEATVKFSGATTWVDAS